MLPFCAQLQKPLCDEIPRPAVNIGAIRICKSPIFT
jgi:hypothetical protein